MWATAGNKGITLFIAYSFLEQMQNMQNSLRVLFGDMHLLR